MIINVVLFIVVMFALSEPKPDPLINFADKREHSGREKWNEDRYANGDDVDGERD